MSLVKKSNIFSGRKRLIVSGAITIINLVAGVIVGFPAGIAYAQAHSSESPTDPAEGQQMVSRNLLLTPNKAKKEVNRAREDFLRGKSESALKEVARALEIAPDCAIALTVRGALDLQMNHSERAEGFFQKAIDNDPTLGAAYVGLATIFISDRRFKEALTPLDRAAGLLPNSWYMHFVTGLAQLGVGEVQSARKEADLAERFAGSNPESRSGVSYLHALVSIELNNLVDARKYLHESVMRDPGGHYSELAMHWRERLPTDVIQNR